MAKNNTAIGQLKDGAARKTRQAARVTQGAANNPWVSRLARFGYIARGALYAIIGLLALQLALGDGGRATDQTGAIATLGSQPFGKFLLVLIAIGLTGYSMWGFVRAIWDPLGKGHDKEGLVQRFGYLVSAVSYGALVTPTMSFITGSGRGGHTGSPQDLSAQLLKNSSGVWIVGLIGLFWLAAAAGQFYQAYTASFMEDFKASKMNANEEKQALNIGRFGLAARGVVFALIGFFLIQAALHANPNDAKGLDGALLVLAQQPYGQILLAIVALGLIAFGVYSFFCARWLRGLRD